jgi:hypothetical protein
MTLNKVLYRIRVRITDSWKKALMMHPLLRGLFQALLNAEDNFKSSGPVENKRHTNAHQPSPPSQQQRLQSPPLRHSKNSQCLCGSSAVLLLFP